MSLCTHQQVFHLVSFDLLAVHYSTYEMQLKKEIYIYNGIIYLNGNLSSDIVFTLAKLTESQRFYFAKIYTPAQGNPKHWCG